MNEEEWPGGDWITVACRDIGSCPLKGDEDTSIWKQQQPTALPGPVTGRSRGADKQSWEASVLMRARGWRKHSIKMVTV